VQVTDTAVLALSLLPNLEELDLRNHQALGPRSLDALVKGVGGRSLHTLRLANCMALCEQGLELVSRLPNLEHLELSYTGTLPMWTAPLLAGLPLAYQTELGTCPQVIWHGNGVGIEGPVNRGGQKGFLKEGAGYKAIFQGCFQTSSAG
jgi:hypothetical protein